MAPGSNQLQGLHRVALSCRHTDTDNPISHNARQSTERWCLFWLPSSSDAPGNETTESQRKLKVKKTDDLRVERL